MHIVQAELSLRAEIFFTVCEVIAPRLRRKERGYEVLHAKTTFLLVSSSSGPSMGLVGLKI